MSPKGGVLGDFDEDGHLDVALAGDGSGLGILLGRSEGTFGGLMARGDGTPTIAIASLDVDHDGHLDVITLAASHLDVRLGDGTTHFAPPQSYSVAATTLAVGDVTGDGNADYVLAAGFYPRTFATLIRGDGQGGFGQRTDLPVPSGYPGVAIGDVTGDGLPDIVVHVDGTNSSTTLTIFPGTGTDAFGSPITVSVGAFYSSQALAGIAIGDLNGDGHPDIVTTANYQHALLFGDGAGGFSAPTYIYGMPSAIAIADVNGDGRPDILSCGYSTNLPGGSSSSSLVLELGSASGTFTFTYLDCSAGPQSLAVADVNGDGRPDLVVPCAANLVTVFENDATGFGGRNGFASGSIKRFGNCYEASAVGDFTGDGIADLAIASQQETNLLHVAPGLGGGAFGPLTSVTSSGLLEGSVGARPMIAADLDGDGRTDLIAASYYVSTSSSTFGTTVTVLLQSPGGGFQAPRTYAAGTGPSSLALGDLDGDGNADLVVTDYGKPADYYVAGGTTISILRGDGHGNFGPPASVTTGINPFAAAIGDANGDGHADVLVANYNSSTVSVIRGVGDGSLSVRYDYVTGGKATSVALADLDGDGKMDLIAGTESPGSLSVWPGFGDGTFGNRIDVNTGSYSGGSPVAVAVSDLDGDGKPDLLVTRLGTDELIALHGLGNFLFYREPSYGTDWRPQQVDLADLDADGAPDAVVRCWCAFATLRNRSPQPLAVVGGRAVHSGVAVRIASANPGGALLRLEAHLQGNAPSRIELYDVTGRLLLTRALTGGGRQVVDLSRETPSTPGVYLVRLHEGRESASARWIRLH